MSWCNYGFVPWYLYIVDPIVHYININNFQLATTDSFIHAVDAAIRCIRYEIVVLYWQIFVNIDGFVTEPKYVVTL